MLFACIFVPDFVVEAVVRAEPELRNEAVAILDGTPPLLRVVAANEVARAAGVDIAMTKVQAEGKVAGLALRRRSPALETAAHAALVDCACAFSPRVEANSATPDTVVLDLDGLERLFGPPPRLAREIARRASDVGLEVNIAVAANIETATLAARGFSGISLIPAAVPNQDRLGARWDGGQERERLGALPVDVLLSEPESPTRAFSAGRGRDRTSTRPPIAGTAEMLETLDRWGIRTLRALAALPETAVQQRLGDAGIRWQKLARGEGSRPLVPTEPPQKFEEATELESPIALLEPLAFVLNRMLEQLCARLSARACATQQLTLRLALAPAAGPDDSPGAGHESELKPPAPPHSAATPPQPSAAYPPTSAPTRQKPACLRAPTFTPTGDEHAGPDARLHVINLRLPVPMVEPKVFLKLLQLELRAKPPGAPVERIFLSAEPRPPRFTQGGLFLPTTPEPEKLALTLARIAALVKVNAKAKAQPEGAPAATENSGTRHCSPSDDSELRVGSPEPLAMHRPDAFRMKPFAPPAADSPGTLRSDTSASGVAANGEQSNGEQSNGEQSNDEQAEPRAAAPGAPASPVLACWGGTPRAGVRRFRPPLALKVALRDGNPASIEPAAIDSVNLDRQIAGGNCVWAAGPWRESGEWWAANGWSREVWDVAVESSPPATDELSGRHGPATVLYRIYRDAIQKGWFLEAMYD